MKQYVLVALLALLVACTPAQQTMEKKEVMMDKQPVMEEKKEMVKEPVMEKEAMTKPEGKMMPGLIGGDVSRYYNWDKAMFDQAVSEGKTIYLEFSASWCGACQKQEPELIAGFAELNDPNVVGFKIPYKDSETTSEHTALAQQYQVPYQHYKVILKNGQIIKRSPEAWTKSKMLEVLRSL